MEPRDTIGEADLWNARLPPDLHVTLARNAHVDISWDQLEHYNRAKEHSFDK